MSMAAHIKLNSRLKVRLTLERQQTADFFRNPYRTVVIHTPYEQIKNYIIKLQMLSRRLQSHYGSNHILSLEPPWLLQRI